VITGFIGKDREGRITTLGRGGSDLSATVFGAASLSGMLCVCIMCIMCICVLNPPFICYTYVLTPPLSMLLTHIHTHIHTSDEVQVWKDVDGIMTADPRLDA
jgi:hypothetical protein